MYGSNVSAAAGSAAAGTGALAHTGADVFWLVVTALAAIMLGLMFLRLRPKKEF